MILNQCQKQMLQRNHISFTFLSKYLVSILGRNLQSDFLTVPWKTAKELCWVFPGRWIVGFPRAFSASADKQSKIVEVGMIQAGMDRSPGRIIRYARRMQASGSLKDLKQH